jgi:hypothetical protein
LKEEKSNGNKPRGNRTVKRTNKRREEKIDSKRNRRSSKRIKVNRNIRKRTSTFLIPMRPSILARVSKG